MSTAYLLQEIATLQPVQCLGLTFENHDARRHYFKKELEKKLQDTEFKKISGFPKATDAAIIAISDPPYYTACPNPWLSDIMAEWATIQKTYHREAFSADVSEGKNHPIYNAHSYHTKLPHKTIMHYILHYTEPGDVVFDGFCGTGMTAVAAQLCGDRSAIFALGYQILIDGTINAPEEDENGQIIFKPFSKLGVRRTILNDLSPAATFIAYNYNIPVDILSFEQEALQLVEEIEAECKWMYHTLHYATQECSPQDIQKVVLGDMECPMSITLGRINDTIWSDVFMCSACAQEVVFWNAAVKDTKIQPHFPCPHCKALLTKRTLERAWTTYFDKALGDIIRQKKQVPVLIHYSINHTRFTKTPDDYDIALLHKIENSDIPYWFPTDALPKGDKTIEPCRLGITHVHHFYSKRNIWVLALMRDKTLKSSFFHLFQSILRSSMSYSTKMVKVNVQRLLTQRGMYSFGALSGTLYIPSLNGERHMIDAITGKIRSIKKSIFLSGYQVYTTSQNAGDLTAIPSNSQDYLFIDPPFGSNLMYSELNFIWESWIQVFTNTIPEAIVNKAQGKKLQHYQALMRDCFIESFRILKPGHWMTIVFSNTQARIWNTLQTTLMEAGFVIANVSALDKQQGSFKAVNTTTAVKQDLSISAYKPKDVDTVSSVWDFIRSHLKYLPITQCHGTMLEFIVEREPHILYDRTVAYFMSQGYPVPLSSQQFQAGLHVHFHEKDGMIFLHDQIKVYEHKRHSSKIRFQMAIFVSDERSAIDWLRLFLTECPSTHQDIHPKFTKLIGASWKKYELMQELESLLVFNFLKYDGNAPVPPQIQSYLFKTFLNCRHLTPEDPILQQRALERWYVPDPHQALDLEKIRETHLLREFKQYCDKKRLKGFRLEVIRAGFKKSWSHQDYHIIVDMAAKIPESVLYEDEQLLQIYDLATIRMEKEGTL